MQHKSSLALAIGELFSQDGPLANAIPGFAERSEQIAMAELVADTFAGQSRIAIEAGTGIGKTFAYLAPALLAKKRIVVSTGTRTLQDQLFHRDLPMITSALGVPVRVAILKGRANYLCVHRMEITERELALGTRPGPRRSPQQRVFDRVRRWAVQTSRGDIGELATVSEADPIWPSVTSTRENCLGVECPAFQRCHVAAARREAQAADVVIVNHYLLMADLLLKERGFGDLLPGADAIVIDEAHQLPEIAQQFLGYAVSTRQIQHLCRDIALELQTQRAASEAISRAIAKLESTVAETVDVLQSERCEYEQWPSAFIDALADLERQLGSVSDALVPFGETMTAMAAAKERADELAERLGQLHDSPNNKSPEGIPGVRWAQANRQGFSVHFAPIDVASQLSTLIETHSASWVFTSATLAVNGDFSHYLRRIGLSDARTALFGSPFDYPNQSLLYLPRGLDEPASLNHTRQVVEAALPILAASGGRAFLLFTSHRALRLAASYLRAAWGPKPPYPLFVQGDAPRDVLLHAFREAGNAVLLGTGSFWEGVDVKGPALSVVVIDKLPFAMPDDPVLKARLAVIEERGGSPFFEEQVPQAAIALKQGVGRLIRDVLDFGVIMLGDRRVISKPYGRIILNSLPPMPRTDQLSDVTVFLRMHLERAGIQVNAVKRPEEAAL